MVRETKLPHMTGRFVEPKTLPLPTTTACLHRRSPPAPSPTTTFAYHLKQYRFTKPCRTHRYTVRRTHSTHSRCLLPCHSRASPPGPAAVFDGQQPAPAAAEGGLVSIAAINPDAASAAARVSLDPVARFITCPPPPALSPPVPAAASSAWDGGVGPTENSSGPVMVQIFGSGGKRECTHICSCCFFISMLFLHPSSTSGVLQSSAIPVAFVVPREK